jgi:gliding motility-associated lipoprotein GldH
MTNKWQWALITFLSLGVLFGCQEEQRVYEKYLSIADYQWSFKDTLDFKVPIKDTSNAYQLALKLRNKINYPYRNIWLLIQHEAPSGKLSSIKAEFQLAKKSGKWTGQGIGDLYDHRFPVRQNISLTETGTHRFRVVHLMRKNKLPGVMNVGLQLRKGK